MYELFNFLFPHLWLRIYGMDSDMDMDAFLLNVDWLVERYFKKYIGSELPS